MHIKLNHKRNHGDTLIEVMFATAVFSFVAVAALAIMNQGLSTAQRALEITLVRNEIDAQAEALRFINASYISQFQPNMNTYSGTSLEWRKIVTYLDTIDGGSISPFGANGMTECPDIPDGSFILDARKALFISPAEDNTEYENNEPTLSDSFARVNYDDNTFSSANGIWIEAIRIKAGDDPASANQEGVGYVDFHIRACWDSPGQPVPVTIGTIVRLYEPYGN